MPAIFAGMVVEVAVEDVGAGVVVDVDELPICICMPADNCVGVPRKQPMEYGYSLFST